MFEQEGVEKHEERTLYRLNVAALIAALATIPALLLAFSSISQDGIYFWISTILNYAIYGVFLIEAIFLVKITGSFRKYLYRNKLDVVVLMLTLPFLPQVLKALWVLRLLRLVDTVPQLLNRQVNLSFAYYALIVIFFGLYGGALSFHHYEGISIFDGFYWASTTMTGVGYGDITPTNTASKIVAIVIQWAGAVALLIGLGQIDEFVQELRKKRGL